MRQMTTKDYRKYIFAYGITTILLVLEHFEKLDNYEECQIIIDAIKELETIVDSKLHTRITNEQIKDVLETYKKFGMTGVNFMGNSEYYAALILDEIEKTK